MQVVLYTQDLELYARVHKALQASGIALVWNEGEGFPLAGPDLLERGQVVLWPTPRGLRAYDLRGYAFLTRRDDPKTLPEGLRGVFGQRLLPGEALVLGALGRGVVPEPRALARALGLERSQARFFLRGVWNKFGLPLGLLLRLARHQVQVAGLEDHPEGLAGPQAEPLLHVPGQEDFQGKGPLEKPPVGEPFRVEAF
ncbi:hypothetical protein SAMN04488243_10399 [Thermus arciformis]|uniref:Uncharacterized protein n=1 Tax=Thermus arciformis TaxID=482827 RepID=A0A1G7DRT6_9DEIN|nr:hypothetical protein SAMN04488243_10399 [Thermus arciformis]